MEENISENEMDDIIKYINGLSFEQYQKDMEIREALELIKSKMIKEEQQKTEKMKEEYQQESNSNNQIDINQFINDKQETLNNLDNSKTNNEINPNKKQEDIEQLETNWNNSVR